MEETQESVPLEDRMKSYESKERIDASQPFVMRFDGHAFSRFTRGTHKPYDYNLNQAFAEVTKYLTKELGADLGYTHSDEISLLFWPKRTRDGEKWREPMFGGKIQKIISIAAGMCTMFFNQKLQQIFENKEDEYKDEDGQIKGFYVRTQSSCAYFDCRIFQLPDDAEMFSYLFWRSKVDCKRNHVFELARRHFTKAELHKKGTGQRIQMLAEKDVDWDKEPACFRRGSFFKRKRRTMPPGQEELVRFDIAEVDVELTKFNEEINEMLKCPVYPPPKKE